MLAFLNDSLLGDKSVYYDVAMKPNKDLFNNNNKVRTIQKTASTLKVLLGLRL